MEYQSENHNHGYVRSFFSIFFKTKTARNRRCQVADVIAEQLGVESDKVTREVLHGAGGAGKGSGTIRLSEKIWSKNGEHLMVKHAETMGNNGKFGEHMGTWNKTFVEITGTLCWKKAETSHDTQPTVFSGPKDSEEFINVFTTMGELCHCGEFFLGKTQRWFQHVSTGELNTHMIMTSHDWSGKSMSEMGVLKRRTRVKMVKKKWWVPQSGP